MPTFRHQLTPVSDRNPVVIEIPGKEFSGAAWVRRFPESVDVEDLVEPFRSNVKRFITALTAAGASVSIASTYRPKERAYLMHYCAAIAHKKIQPEDVPPMEGVGIEWVHPTMEESVQAAAAMAKAYKVVFPPALDSNHTRRRAIDMRIDGVLEKKVAQTNGTLVLIQKHDDNESDLFAVGASYHVFKLRTDKPHWSDNGH